jgi:hypothetical protein
MGRRKYRASVVFEVLSPGNTAVEMEEKLEFYNRYGVEEYYIYDPQPSHPSFSGYIRRGQKLKEINNPDGWKSPRLGVVFDMSPGELRVVRPDGETFATYEEIEDEAALNRKLANDERNRANSERERANSERERADIERERAESERERANRLTAKLKALGI